MSLKETGPDLVSRSFDISTPRGPDVAKYHAFLNEVERDVDQHSNGAALEIKKIVSSFAERAFGAAPTFYVTCYYTANDRIHVAFYEPPMHLRPYEARKNRNNNLLIGANAQFCEVVGDHLPQAQLRPELVKGKEIPGLEDQYAATGVERRDRSHPLISPTTIGFSFRASSKDRLLAEALSVSEHASPIQEGRKIDLGKILSHEDFSSCGNRQTGLISAKAFFQRNKHRIFNAIDPVIQRYDGLVRNEDTRITARIKRAAFPEKAARAYAIFQHDPIVMIHIEDFLVHCIADRIVQGAIERRQGGRACTKSSLFTPEKEAYVQDICDELDAMKALPRFQAAERHAAVQAMLSEITDALGLNAKVPVR